VRGVAVVSGLARGIDTAAHQGALDAPGVSGAVLGTGVDRAYPRENAALQARLARSLGLMSEIPSGGTATRGTFATRNRLLAAMVDVVVVVQGRAGSGSLITAQEAARLGRPVAAIPWDSREPLGEAPHALIRDGVATLVRDADDVLDLIPGFREGARSAGPAAARDGLAGGSGALPRLARTSPPARSLSRGCVAHRVRAGCGPPDARALRPRAAHAGRARAEDAPSGPTMMSRARRLSP